jgi:fibrillarin-like pre-rRNA processing protein
MSKLRISPYASFEGLYEVDTEEGQQLATLNLSPGKGVYGERLIEYQGKEYRLMNPYRSKLAAAVVKGTDLMPIKPGMKVLYLGVASGTTASHVSDIVGPRGTVFGVDFAYRPMRDLINNVCIYRSNLLPILGDARIPESYRTMVGIADCLYCDIAQPEQASILADNADMYLRDGGWAMLAIKARSIDVTKAPSELYERETETMRKRGFSINQAIPLEPFDIDHVMIIAKYR